jgi:glyoxylase-like metal-dependent hydrolase (beta-lactamase superfamily II)
MSAEVLTAIKQISPRPIRWVIDTNSREENTGGSAMLAAAGEPTSDFRGAADSVNPDDAHEAPIISHENAMLRMSGAVAGEARRADGVPWETFQRDTKLYNGEGIQIFYAPAATTDGDVFVYFRSSDVISAGDLFSTIHYPAIDLKRGGSINGVIDGLTHIIELCIFKTQSQGGTYVIPGDGRISDQADVTEYRDMLAIIRDRVENAIKEGKTLAQIKELRLSRDYDPRYGSNDPAYTTDRFIETVFESLTQGNQKK